MGFLDEYNKALQEDSKKSSSGGSKGSYLDEYYKATGGNKESNYRKTYSVGRTANIAPLSSRLKSKKKKKKEEEERSWFKKGLFEDGYDFGDISRTIIGSTTDVLENIGSGIIGMGEKAVDTMAYIAPFAENAQFYQNGGFNLETEKVHKQMVEQSKKDLGKFIAKDLYDEEAVARAIISDPARMVGIDSESHSVFGEKSDALIQSGGQLLATAGLSAVGLPWWATTGATSFGSEAENALNQGATYEEAGASAAISAGAEILSEKLSGGISFGGKTLDDSLTKLLARGISDKTARTLAKLGFDMAGEGAEEVFSQVASNIGSSLYKEEDLKELLLSEEAFDEYLESFIGGSVLGGVAGSFNAVKSNSKGVDYASGLTGNEQKVVDKLYKDEVASREKEGKVTQKEKSKIYDEILEDMEKGYISTDTLEEILGGDSYSAYKNTIDSEDSQIKELEDQIAKLADEPNTVGNSRKYDELQSKLTELKNNSQRNTMKSQLSDSIYSLVKGDRLAESYNERSRRGQAFEADLSQYDTKQQETIKKAAESGILNNTRRTHEFVDFVSKISADTGVLFDFSNTEKLRESGYVMEGQTIDGLYNPSERSVTVNIDSPKSRQFVVGHEITHALEGTELYDVLRKTVFDYAKMKNQYGVRMESIQKRYKEGTDFESELTADLVGEYIFSDTDFINNLSTQHRNVFEKVYNEIKYLCKVATAGSKEARELEKVKRAFEKAYREGSKAQGETKYSLGYHAGDLGKAESYAQMSGGRSTGHFGTGTYFVGNKAAIEGYNKRNGKPAPVETVDFDRYNLYKVSNDEKGFKLHRLLQTINGGFSQEHLNAAIADKYKASTLWDDAYERGDSYDEKVWNDELEDEMSKDYFGSHNRAMAEVAEENGIEFLPYDEWLAEMRKEESSDYDWDEIDYNDYLKEILNQADEARNEGYREFKKAHWDLRWQFYGQDINSALQAVVDHDKSMEQADIDTKYISDSRSTVFMKALGYEGIDVRGTKLDNTTYGSVIYDLKGEDAKRKAEIGTAKYSLSDSDGKQLTKEQQEYFKDSKMRDDNGSLKVMYHGSQDAGFHVFDSKFSDDETSFFFVDRNDVAATYSGTTETYEAKTIRTAEDMNNFIAEINADGYEVVEQDGKFVLMYDGDQVATSDTAKGIYKEFCWYEGVGEGDANYKVYLNLKNPLVIDAEGRNWDNVSSEFWPELYEQWQTDFTPEEKAALVDLAGWEDFGTFKAEIERAVRDAVKPTADEYTKYLDSAYWKNSDMSSLFSMAADNFSDEVLRAEAIKRLTTRDYAQKAKTEGYDGVIFKNIVDIGGYGNGREGAATVAIAFDSNQIKSVANGKPTVDPDIRYSLSEDNEGRKISPAIAKRFGNSKVVDENGNLKTVYHGTASGEFSIFDKSKGSVEGDFGSGFYFTDNESDVSEHYEGGGPDFDNKVARLAEQIEADEDIDYDEAEERARAELYKGSHKFEVYLNIENPAIVGKTYLFDSDFGDRYNEEDFDDYDEYVEETEQAVADAIDEIIWEVEKNVDVYSTDGLADVIYEAYYEGGIGLEELKDRINQLYLEDNEGNFVGNEVVRQIIESLGYDGIIDPTVSGKWNMDIEDGTTHYIVFKPNQIKAVTNQNPTDNPDIHRSLSKIGERHTPDSLSALRLETAEESSVVAPTVSETESVREMFPDDGVDEQEELENLISEEEELRGVMEAYAGVGDIEAVNKLIPEHESIQARIKELQQHETDRADSLTDADAPMEMDAPLSMKSEQYDPFANTTVHDINRKTRSYSDRNPGARLYLEGAALGFAYDVNNSTHGEKWYNDQLYYESGGEKGFGGTKRVTTDDIAELKDTYGYTWEQLSKAADDVAKGEIRSVAAKRVEYLCHKRLMEGYTDVDGRPIPANQDYISFLNETFANEQRVGSVDNLLENADQYAPEDIAPVKKAPLKPASTKLKDIFTGDAPIFDGKDGQTTMFAPEKKSAPTGGKVARVTTEEETPTKKRGKFWSLVKEHVLDNGMVFEDLSKETGNREIEAKWNFIRYSRSRAQRLIGEGANGVKALKDIKKTVDKSGKTAYFYDYLYHKHNVDRMSLEDRFDNTPNKAVFGDSVTSEISQRTVERYEKQNPEFLKWAEDVYGYMNHLRNLLVENNVISQETADLWEKMYPHYVPIRRKGMDGLNINVPLDSRKTTVNNPIKRAIGGNQDILDLFNTMAQRTTQTYRAIARNSFGIELKNQLGTVVDKNAPTVDDVIDGIDTDDALLKPGELGSNPTFTVFENGERVEFEITEEMYEAMKPKSEAMQYRNKILSTASGVFRGLTTQYSIPFMATNAIKDAQDVLINSQHPAKTYANFPRAWWQQATNGKWYQEYIENGGEDNTYFDNETNAFKEDNWLMKGVKFPLNAISAANNFIELTPRLSEYIASREAGRSIEVSMLDAARVTTNFAAGGDVTKFLNSNGATFLNASVQGAVQQVRNIREAHHKGLMGYVGLATKFALAGLPTVLLNNMLWDDDEDYEDLADYVKQDYYVVGKYDDGKFIRIPKGRTVAVIQNAIEQVQNAVTGDDEVDLKNFLTLAVNNLAPNNPLENNILAPIMQVAKNETWYGEELIPSRLQDLPAAEQFDEKTDSFSRKIGETFDISPYKVNYLLNQYSGGLGDLILPMMTPRAESGDDSLWGNLTAPLRDKFTTDSVINSQVVTDYYDTKDALAVKANSSKATEDDYFRDLYMDTVGYELSDLYKQKREIQNSDMSDSEKYTKSRELQEQIVERMKQSLNSYDNINASGVYAEVGDKRYNKDADSGKWYEIKPKNADGSDNWYYQKEQEVTKGLGISYEQYWNNREEYNFAYDKPGKYAVAKSVGGYDSYMKHYDVLENWQSDSYLRADKDSDGNSISGSRKEKVIDYINGLDADYGEKIILYRTVYSSKSDQRTYNMEIIDYLNSRDDISYSDMELILEELGMEVDSEGNISW